MLHRETKAHRAVRYATAAVLMLAFALSFFSCIQETFVSWFPERMDGIEGWVEYRPMLPGFIRSLLIPAAALLLVGKTWAGILSAVFLVLPLLTALGMNILYEALEPMGGLGGYTYAYTPLGRIVVGLLLLGCAGESVIFIIGKKKKHRVA